MIYSNPYRQAVYLLQKNMVNLNYGKYRFYVEYRINSGASMGVHVNADSEFDAANKVMQKYGKQYSSGISIGKVTKK